MARQAIEGKSPYYTGVDETHTPPARPSATLGMRGGLGKTLLIAFLLLTIIPLSLLAILIYNQIEHDASQKLITSLDTVVALKEAHLVDWVEGYERELSLLANASSLEGDLSTRLETMPNRDAALTAMVLLEEKTGDVLASTGLEEEALESLRELLDTGERLSIVPLDEGGALSTSDEFVTPLVVIGHTGGERHLVGLLSWESLQEIVAASASPEEGIVTYLVTEEGLLISADGARWLPLEDAPLGKDPEDSAEDSAEDGQKSMPDGLRQALQGRSGSGSYTNLDGVPVFGAYRWSPELGVALLAEQLQTEALTTVNTLTAVVIGSTLVVALITTVIAAVVTRRITRPIVQLTETAAWMARGNLTQQVKITRRDEIGVLARAFNRMASELRVLYANLEAKVAERTQQLQEATERTSYYVMQLSLSAEVARVATSIRDVDTLLTTVAGLIKDAFELDHVSVYLLESGDGALGTAFAQKTAFAHGNAVSEGAAEGKVPSMMLERWTVWRAGGTGPAELPERAAMDVGDLVGQVASDGQRRVVRRDSPLEYEMAVPLRIRERLLGVLDLRSRGVEDADQSPYADQSPDADRSAHAGKSPFDENDQMVYQSLADQISISIENARAYALERETVKRLQELDRIQSEFLTNMSHALRTPLNSIIGFSRVMLKELDGPLSDLQRSDLTTVYDSGRQLLGLINDMLELTQLDLGTASFSITDVDLSEIIEGVMATARALARSKPIQLHEEVPEDLPSLQTDGQRVRQVILALLTNAIKYTEEGSIRLRVSVADEQVTISVKDTGRGIPREERDRLFAESPRGAVAGEEETHGFGLAISKRVVEKLGGEIWVKSTEGIGSMFTFTLPVRTVGVGDLERPRDEARSETGA